jgi:hypothetical protein
LVGYAGWQSSSSYKILIAESVIGVSFRGAVAQMIFPVVATLLQSAGRSFSEEIRRFIEAPPYPI